VKQINNQKPFRVVHIDTDKKRIDVGFKEMKESGITNFYWHRADILTKSCLENMIHQKIIYVPKSVNVFSSYLSFNFDDFHLANSGNLNGDNILHWMSTFLADDGYFIGIRSLKLAPAPTKNNSEKKKEEKEEKKDEKDDDVGWKLFVKCAEKFGLRLISTEMFEDLYKKYSDSNLSLEEMKISFSNQTFVFQKNILDEKN
jgi:hypothetical protein